MRRRFAVFVGIVQFILFAGHLAIYATWSAFWFRFGASGHPGNGLRITFFLLSISFVIASVIGMRYSNFVVRIVYITAAVWLGMIDMLLMAAAVCWILWGFLHAAGSGIDPRFLVAACYAAGAGVGVYGLINAAAMRVKRVSVKLKNLPEQWKGRVAAVASDLHLGHVRGPAFAARIAKLLNSFRPDVILLAGDVFDGSKANPSRLGEPLRALSAPFGTFFVSGNHEEFGDPGRFINAIKAAEIRVLDNEKIDIDGLQIVGVNYRSCTHAGHLASVLAELGIDRQRASLALVHAPNNLPTVEEAGISLQISGHTHGGQMFPFTWFTRRVYHQFIYGLQHLGELMVLTSSGAGTWGPPMRIGTDPEVVLVRFE